MSQIFKFKRTEKDPEYNPGYINFENLVGTKANLYYHNKFNEFQLGRMIFKVLEDEDDGYRSSLDSVNIVTTSAPLRQKLAEIEIKYLHTNDSDLYQLIDTEDGHKWLEFGTNNTDDYYPCFIFNSYPKS